jgi:hypothetical protein
MSSFKPNNNAPLISLNCATSMGSPSSAFAVSHSFTLDFVSVSITPK